MIILVSTLYYYCHYTDTIITNDWAILRATNTNDWTMTTDDRRRRCLREPRREDPVDIHRIIFYPVLFYSDLFYYIVSFSNYIISCYIILYYISRLQPLQP